MTTTFLTSPDASGIEPGRPHTVLVGLPGAGKSTVGAGVAARLGRTFLDLDREIERRQGTTVAAIFAERGEHEYRKLELKLTRELSALGNMILSPGGGWVTNPEVVALLRPPGRIIYLKVSPQRAIERLGPDAGSRPLLMRPDPLAELMKLFAARKGAYEAADQQIDTELLTPQQVIDNVAELVRGFGRT